VTLDLSAAANYMEMRQRGAVGSDLAEMQQRTMLGTGLATPTSGYTLVPETWEYMIYASLVSHSGVRQAGPRVVTTQNGDPMHFPTGPNLRDVPADRTHYAPAEGTAIAAGGEHDLTFDEVVLGAFRYMSILPVARTFLVDQQTNLESFLPDYLAKDIAHLSENDLLHGDGGANEPQGVLQHGVAANTVTVVDKDAVTYANLVEAKYRLDPALHNQANRANWSAGTPMGGMIVWMMHPETFANVLFIEGGDKRLALIPSARDGEPDRILGHPVVLSPGMPDIGTVSSKIILVGNFTQAYVVRQVGSLELATSEHVEFRANQIVFRTTLRCDAAYIDQSAIAVIATPSS
jgi:HK97 family phage major capsid protein